MRWIATLAASALMASATNAAPLLYQSDLLPGSIDLSYVPAVGNLTGDPSTWSYFRFHATAGANVTIEVNRLHNELDPVAGVFEGLFADTDDLLPFLDIYGGLAYGDDEDPAYVNPGPFGDPNFTFSIVNTGWYTVAVASGVSGIDPFNSIWFFEISATGTDAVPEPGMIGLLGLGLAGLVAAQRRRRV